MTTQVAPDRGETQRPGPTWTLALRAPCPWLNANDRLNRYVQAEYVSRWRSAAFVAAQRLKLPKGLHRVRIEPTLHFPAGHRRDAPNWAPTIKACVDGLGPAILRLPTPRNPKGSAAPGYGLIPDDNAKHLDLRETVIGALYDEVAKQYGLPRSSTLHWIGALVLVITDLSEEAPDAD